MYLKVTKKCRGRLAWLGGWVRTIAPSGLPGSKHISGCDNPGRGAFTSSKGLTAFSQECKDNLEYKYLVKILFGPGGLAWPRLRRHIIMKFINVNGRILDYSNYRKQAKAVEAEAMHEIEEVLGKYGFRVETENAEKIMINDKLNLVAKIVLGINGTKKL